MNGFEFYCPTRIEFGINSVEQLKEYMASLSIQNPAVVTDKVIRHTPMVEKIIENMGATVVFDDVEPNPTSDIVMALKRFVEEHSCDGLVVFGGGSSMDSAKGAAVVSYTQNEVKDFYDFAENQIPITKALPIIAIPTTSGTGSEVSKYSVITDKETNIKRCLTSDLIVPKVAIIDPVLTMGMPPAVTVSTGLDALSHAIESLLSTIENPITTVLAFNAIRLIFDNLNRARVNGNDLEARSNMAFAALSAGIAMSHCCGTMCHAMGCQLTSRYHVPHGLACAVIQKYGLDYAGERSENIKNLVKYINYTDCSTEEAITIMQKKIDDLFVSLDTAMNLKEYSMNEEWIDIMTKDAMEHGCMGLNPVEMDFETVKKLFIKLS